MTVSRVHTGTHRVSCAAQVNAPAHVLFVLLADPARHPEVDGSGSVRGHVHGLQLRAVGDRFSMKMRLYGLTYHITSVVTAIEDDRLIEWSHPLGHRWRWEFTPLGAEPSAERAPTMVTETFDYGAAGRLAAPFYGCFGLISRNADGIEDTLRRLQRRYPVS